MQGLGQDARGLGKPTLHGVSQKKPPRTGGYSICTAPRGGGGGGGADNDTLRQLFQPVQEQALQPCDGLCLFCTYTTAST